MPAMSFSQSCHDDSKDTMAPHLLSLPIELRDMIYTYIFATDDSIQLHLDMTPTSILLRLNDLPLRSVCKQIREETRDAKLYRYNTFDISLPGDSMRNEISYRELHISEYRAIQSVNVTGTTSFNENHVTKKEVLNVPLWLSEDVLGLKTRLPGLTNLAVSVFAEGPSNIHHGPWLMACRSQARGWRARIQEWNEDCRLSFSYLGDGTVARR
ncbi:hypothetical protein PMIN03_012550 [Paraphaeosphaeria minitans]